MEQTIPIPTLHLFHDLDQCLIDLLSSLSLEDWRRQTLARNWTVKDVAAHLLDGNIRSLSASRDHYAMEASSVLNSYDTLVHYLNELNQEWVMAMKRVSTEMIIEMLSMTNKMYRDHLAQLPPFGKAIFPVAWAGEEQSQNWFHIAREYTEKWHHQQQIWEVVDNLSPLFSEEFFKPYLDTSLCALPYHFRMVQANEGESISIVIYGTEKGTWNFTFSENKWKLNSVQPEIPVTKIELDGRLAWRIFSKQISKSIIMEHTRIQGNTVLAHAFFDINAVMI